MGKHQFVDNSILQKFRYETDSELVRFHVFRVPPGTSATTHHAVKFTVDPLTPDFYPKIFMNKIEMNEEASNTALLRYPNLIEHDLVFGENPFYQLNPNKFEYSFTGSATQPVVYYTVAI